MFSLEGVFGTDSTQKFVFDTLVQPMVLDAMKGYNMTLFTFGQTGSGKTFTMSGIIGSPCDKGIISRTAETLYSFDKCKVKLSCMEIYQEKLFDLLIPSSGRDHRLKSHGQIRIRQQKSGEVWVQGLTEREPGINELLAHVIITISCTEY